MIFNLTIERMPQEETTGMGRGLNLRHSCGFADFCLIESCKYSILKILGISVTYNLFNIYIVSLNLIITSRRTSGMILNYLRESRAHSPIQWSLWQVARIAARSLD